MTKLTMLEAQEELERAGREHGASFSVAIMWGAAPLRRISIETIEIIAGECNWPEVFLKAMRREVSLDPRDKPPLAYSATTRSCWTCDLSPQDIDPEIEVGTEGWGAWQYEVAGKVHLQWFGMEN